MNIRNIDRALFTGLFVGIIIFIKEILFSGINAFISILIGAIAALIGYLIGDKILPRKSDNN
ncbi:MULTISPECIES: hypothetical protein [Bacillaceae]|uniref:Uncharacterized protein n=1 Tax=Lentibacillus salicampi TaxID=175306 RepID=A0A4Y9A821_9BACI|nr:MULTISPECIES: hypothetical protein [Bacillaceae]AIF45307.1 hypothetical protein X953_06870 [Virgibacillus sp. SK37]MEC2158483.1 hypothetical protein [Virgibacillus halodenitrificans]TFJ91247.1 hypothetical protein E4U82_18740 [Lentibacillus salicampi]